jgi:CRP-like cAMP-binding protein
LDQLSGLPEESPFKEALSVETRQALVELAIRKNYAGGEILVHQGQRWPYLFLIMEGEISAIKESVEGRTFLATTLKRGDIFWGLGFFREEVDMPIQLRANTNASLLLWSRDSLEHLLKNKGELSWMLCQLMVERIRLASEIVEELAFHPVKTRLASLLLDTFGDAEEEFMARVLTLEDMAARIGTTREMVCRYLYRLAEEGAIEIRRTELRIKDRQLLESQIN